MNKQTADIDCHVKGTFGARRENFEALIPEIRRFVEASDLIPRKNGVKACEVIIDVRVSSRFPDQESDFVQGAAEITVPQEAQ